MEFDEQTGMFQWSPADTRELDYENLQSLNAVLPFISSITHFGMMLIEFDELRGHEAISKFIHRMLSKDTFNFLDFLVNVDDFDDWDYAYKLPNWHKSQ